MYAYRFLINHARLVLEGGLLLYMGYCWLQKKKKETSIPEGTDVNEVSVRSTPRPMSTGHRSRSMELLPPFESRHYSHK